MNFESASTGLVEQVKGFDTYEKGGDVKVPVKGLLAIVQQHVREPADLQVALSELGYILGVAVMLKGVRDRGPSA